MGWTFPGAAVRVRRMTTLRTRLSLPVQRYFRREKSTKRAASDLRSRLLEQELADAIVRSPRIVKPKKRHCATRRLD